MKNYNVKGFFKALKLIDELKERERGMGSDLTICKTERIQIAVAVQHIRPSATNSYPENTIILDDEDITYFKNKYKDALKQELEEEINDLKKQYEL